MVQNHWLAANATVPSARRDFDASYLFISCDAMLRLGHTP
jgi:hypothetical protein